MSSILGLLVGPVFQSGLGVFAYYLWLDTFAGCPLRHAVFRDSKLCRILRRLFKRHACRDRSERILVLRHITLELGGLRGHSSKSKSSLVTLKELLRGDSTSPRIPNLELVSGSVCESETRNIFAPTNTQSIRHRGLPDGS